MAEDENLTGNAQEDIISTGEDNTSSNTGADPSGSEDTLEGLKSVIRQQQEVIAVMSGQIDSFKSQWETAVRKGAAFTDSGSSSNATPTDTQSLQDDYVPLKDLDFRLDKKNYM